MAFKCNKCNKSWPDAKNKMDDPNGYENDGICPECYEETDDDSERPGYYQGHI